MAPASYWVSNEKTILEHTGGCGPGELGDALVPDTAWGESLFLACQIHDWMYWKAQEEEDRKIADRVFLYNMLELIEFDRNLFDRARRYRAMTYYAAVREHGRIDATQRRQEEEE